ncbi:hypothetical protein EUX98_g8532 [Antrodiella citrinella]|uniref:Uncharacterized protein n=1 Tax=Antrodiella citrinella TaxID=2447956 RepID=A0A4S4M613_9APHY|nr:hypothetical protein EUX98_g8532 [Antrodiella citrinella]
MPSHLSAPIFAAALTQVVKWLEFKTFGRASWYDRAVLLLREASDAAPSLDDLKLDGVRMEVRSALKDRVITAHPPDAFFEELAMPVTPAGARIFASELDELDTITGDDYVALSARVEERWAEADRLWREKAAPRVAKKKFGKSNARPQPTPVVPPSPKISLKRKGAPLSSDGEDSSPPPARPGTQKVVLSSLFELTSGGLVVETDDDDDAPYEDEAMDSKSIKKQPGRPSKRSKVTKTDKESFPDEDPDAVESEWFVYRELRKCLKCSSSRASGGAVCRMYEGETRCRRCSRTAQGCYWEISPGAIPVSYSGAHKQSRDAAAVSTRAGSQPHVSPASTLFVSHSEAARPVFRVDAITSVDEFPSCLASIRRRAALARIHPASHPASRAIADVVEQSLASAQVQLTTGLMLARSLLRDGAPGFRGTGVDPEELEDPLDDDLPVDFTEDSDHPIAFRLEATPPVVPRGCSSPSPAVLVPPRPVEAGGPLVPTSSRPSPDVVSESGSPKIADIEADEDAEGSEGGAEEVDEGDDDSDEGPRAAELMPGTEA